MLKKSICFLSLLMVAGCASHGMQANSHLVKIDRISPEELTAMMPLSVARLSLDDVLALTRQGMRAEDIIEKIKQSDSIYDLTPSQTLSLNAQGVDGKVLDYMHSSHELALRNHLAEEINKRERSRAEELAKLKLQMQSLKSRQSRYCGYGAFHPYGFYGSGFRSGFSLGARYYWPSYCW
ncbi:MAG: hypothetical protein CVU29_07835 [Betaproteobacteria bacterium HGW-Betaproteobacteria-22]|nr:MAG: hypothetical protein CVU29_07835 [Betaproteobacteria bacterium HGW-Betaproteobacteria-22]